MAAATLLSWVAWGVLVVNTNPLETSIGGFIMFYVTLCMGLIGSLTILGLSYRVLVLKRHDVVSREVRVSFRHAVLLSAICVGLLALSAAGWLRWWAFLVLVIAVIGIEYIFLISDESRRV